ncbi:MAG: hypothetical protein AAFS01_05410 [Pseudomonadota bacterium]
MIMWIGPIYRARPDWKEVFELAKQKYRRPNWNSDADQQAYDRLADEAPAHWDVPEQ